MFQSFAKALREYRVYLHLLPTHLNGGQSITDLIRTRFPFALRLPSNPIWVTLEFSNICNLGCTYCQSPLNLRPRGLMDEETFSALLCSLRKVGLKRLHIVGNGESTIHPRFCDYARRLRKVVPLLDIVTNGSWARSDIIDALLLMNRIDVSVAGTDSVSYLKNRAGGSWDRVNANMAELRAKTREMRNPPTIVARVMVRPSESADYPRLIDYWRRLCDVVHIHQIHEAEGVQKEGDLYSLTGGGSTFRRCSRVVTHLTVTWSGDVPLCGPGLFFEPCKRVLLGNVKDQGLDELYHSPVLEAYRRGHVQGEASLAPNCVGCRYANGG